MLSSSLLCAIVPNLHVIGVDCARSPLFPIATRAKAAKVTAFTAGKVHPNPPGMRAIVVAKSNLFLALFIRADVPCVIEHKQSFSGNKKPLSGVSVFCESGADCQKHRHT